jgi:5'-nucleotidase
MERTLLSRRLWLILAALVVAITTVFAASAAYSKPGPDKGKAPAPGKSDKPGKPAPGSGGTVDVQILGINDFHGNLEPTTAGGRAVGGAAYLDAYLDAREAENPRHTIRAHMGDLVGASPLVSSYFHDEPSVYAANEMGFDIGTIGNHEFDEGGEEMLRLIEGGQRDDGKQFKTGPDGQPVNTSDPNYSGAYFPYVISNVVYADSGKNVLPPYEIINKGGVKIGFIGVSTLETPSIVVPDAVAPFEFLDMSDSVDKYVKELQKKKVETIVVMAHAGAVQSGDTATGEIVPEIEEMSDAVDVVLAGHTHTPLDLRIDGKLVAQSQAFGAQFEDVDLTISRKTKDVVSSEAELVTTFNEGVTPSADIAQLVAGYKEQVVPVSERVVGNAPETLIRPNRSDPTVDGESGLGNLIADAQRQQAGADLAFMNPGGIRADIQAGEVTFGELFTVQPFDNGLSSGELTGAQIYEVLEQQFPPTQAAGTRKILQVSGFEEIVYNESLPAGERIVSATLEDGTPLDPSATYTVAANSFLITGGDGFTVFKEARNVRSFGSDLEALEGYINEVLNGNIVAPEDNDRLTKQG